MGRITNTNHAPYRAMPNKSRFWMHSENCYTPEDLEFRRWVLQARSNSGIHPDYRTNHSTWFSDDSQALINVYENSWIYSTAFKPRHTLTRDDFHIQPIDGPNLSWPTLYNLMQQIGDYLILRNQHLSEDHLNQPMNYVFLDINFMLKGLIQNPNINQVKEQLELITRYVRTIEKNVSPLVGSDRLFLANFRSIITDQIMPHMAHLIESRILQDRLKNLSKVIRQISTERNRILHFALNTQPVNPHAYEFSMPHPENPNAYPTQAIKMCLEKNKPSLEDNPIHSAASPSLIKVLEDCPQVNLITTDNKIRAHYVQAVADLSELEHFQEIIYEINGLLAQAGEVYTIHQFKEQMLHLLEQINAFINESSMHIEIITKANTQAYHHAIQDQQELSLWSKWFTSEETRLKTFIENQDDLEQFPSGLAELDTTRAQAQMHTEEIIKHLNQPRTKESSLAAVMDKTQELDQLMRTMHQWVALRYQSKGLPTPQAPSSIQLIAATAAPEVHTYTTVSPPLFNNTATFFSATSTGCTNDTMECLAPSNTEVNSYALFTLGLIVFIPTIILGLYLLTKTNNKDKVPLKISHSSNNRKPFNKLMTKFEDLLSLCQHDLDSSAILYQPYVDIYSNLKTEASKKIYKIKDLREAYEELKNLYDEYQPGKKP